LPSWTTFTLDLEVLDMTPDFKPAFANTRAELLEMFDKHVAEARGKISAASDEEWQKTWTFKWGGKTIMSMPRAVVMRNTIMNHLIHHRAQLGVFLRLNEVEIPGMYGPSADEQKFWEAAR
jgi:uncharacterized damage-inducible protein DinB